eukprot:6179547-Pyramimonas_sp.AAC.3
MGSPDLGLLSSPAMSRTVSSSSSRVACVWMAVHDEIPCGRCIGGGVCAPHHKCTELPPFGALPSAMISCAEHR